ncbi:sulfite exporter TauE/SafE family protein [Catenovulum sp. SX2]|uniref:sulfite exporter TauE/SafE family protein n=1 Tax=Catenovulum sp. SX2 TaxID=3398614 RepID=UPI003F85A6D2
MSELMQSLDILLALIATGVFAGLLAGLFGVGGGIIIVPILYFLLQGFDVGTDSAMAIAMATSLATIVPTSISSIRAHYKKGNIDVQILKLWSGFIVVFAIVGSVLASYTQGQILTVMFACIALAVALNMLLRANAPAPFPTLPNRFIQSILASVVGGFSVMIGIGGGTIGVPLLTLFNVQAHKAVGTAAVFGLLIALPGVVTLASLGVTPADAPIGNIGLISLPAFLLLIPLTIIFAPIGAKLGGKLSSAQLKRAFAVLLIFISLRMLLQ